MKKGIFLRLALVLVICAWVSSCMLGGTVWAKYVAQGKGLSQARIAGFSFEVGGEKYASGSWLPRYDWSPAYDAAYPTFWEQIVTPNGISSVTQDFALPLFDYEWVSDQYGILLYDGPGGGTVTVKSSDGAMVVAPGIGHAFGAANNNPNLLYHIGSYNHTLYFRNNSEVTLKFKLENITTAADLLNLPFCFDTGPDRLTFYEPYTFPGDSNTGWYNMQPGAVVPVSFWWSWIYDCNAGWGDLGTGMTTDDAYETGLGQQAAAALAGTGTAPKVQAKFRLTVEQVD